VGVEALGFSFPVWNMGFPAIPRGFRRQVFLPGVNFTLGEDGSYNPCLHDIKRPGIVCIYAACDG
jgi:putative NADPH-quinone reductase